MAKFARAVLNPLSKPVAESIAEKIIGFRDGLNALKSWREFVIVAAISLTMWGMIASAYVQTAHAFVETPELGQLSFSRAMLLMAARYRREPAAASNRGMVHADCRHSDGDAHLLRSAD